MPKREMDQWAKELLPFCTEEFDRERLRNGPSSWITSLHYQSLKKRWMKMKGITEEKPPEPKQFASY